jgi:hypothetical protein
MRRSLLTLLATLAPVLFTACDDATGANGTSTLALYLTDAAGEVEHAWVTIDQIELVGEGMGVISVRDEDYSVDLVTLQDDAALLAAPVTVPSGTYSQLRLIVTEACLVVDGDIYRSSDDYDKCNGDGREVAGTLKRPSLEQTGIKVKLPGGSLELDGEDRQLILDWDVAQSFGHQAGKSGSWVMHPVVQAEDVRLTGSITVTLSTNVDLSTVGGSLDDFQAVMSPASISPEKVDFADVNGVWTAIFDTLIPGEYEVSVALEDGVTYTFTVAPASAMLTVPSGGTATEAFTIESVLP